MSTPRFPSDATIAAEAWRSKTQEQLTVVAQAATSSVEAIEDSAIDPAVRGFLSGLVYALASTGAGAKLRIAALQEVMLELIPEEQRTAVKDRLALIEAVTAEEVDQLFTRLTS